MTFANRPKAGGGGVGTPGAAGSVWRTGAGAPSNATGVDSDQYLNTTTGDVYTRGGGVYTVTGNIRGTTGPNPFLMTGLSGGTADRLVYLKSDGVTCADFHPSLLDEANFSQFLWKDENSAYWMPGAIITKTGGGLTPGFVRVAQPQTSLTAVNYRDIDPKAAQPADLAPTQNQDYVECGKILSTTQWRFTEPRVDGVATNPSTRYDGFLVANYPRGATVPLSRFAINQWDLFDGATPSGVNNQTTGTNFPTGAQINFTATGTYKTRLATDQVTAQAADGQVLALVQKSGNTGTIGVGMRLGGTSTTKNGVILTLDDGQPANNCFTMTVYVNNVATTFTYPSFASLTHGTYYWMRLECEGTLIRGKAWAAGTAEPTDWMLTGYTPYIAAGYYGLTANIAVLNVTAYATATNKGADAPTTGVT